VKFNRPYLFVQDLESSCPELDMTTQLPAPPTTATSPTCLTKDLFNLYSLASHCKSKDISERRIRLDFGLVAEVQYLCLINWKWGSYYLLKGRNRIKMY
jgi:hypothetical protein